jgi:hypothetical protein
LRSSQLIKAQEVQNTLLLPESLLDVEEARKSRDAPGLEESEGSKSTTKLSEKLGHPWCKLRPLTKLGSLHLARFRAWSKNRQFVEFQRAQRGWLIRISAATSQRKPDHRDEIDEF